MIDEIVSVSACQILIEMHFNEAVQTKKLLEKLAIHQYLLFSSESNGNTRDIGVREFSFIHRDCLASYGVSTLYGNYVQN